MPNNATHFSVEKVKALRAYFEQSRRSAKGRPDYTDLETTVKLCEQLIGLMEPSKKPDTAGVRASSER
jgi:hypothetical protein